MGVGALPVSIQAPPRLAGRSAVCVADRGGGHRANDDLRAQRDLRSPARRIGYPRRVYALGSSGGADVHRVLEDLDSELEEAAASLGAGRWQTFTRVIYPAIAPAAITGFALAFARGVGEYGSVIFIAGNMPMRTEIAPLLIVTKLEEYDYSGATAIATLMLVISFALLLTINMLQRWSGRRGAADAPVSAMTPAFGLNG